MSRLITGRHEIEWHERGNYIVWYMRRDGRIVRQGRVGKRLWNQRYIELKQYIKDYIALKGGDE